MTLTKQLPPPTTSDPDYGHLWTIASEDGAEVWLDNNHRIHCQAGRRVWDVPRAERFARAILAAIDTAETSWRAM